MPRFEFADAQRLIAALGVEGGKCDPGAEAFITTMEGREPENWSAEIVHLPDGRTVRRTEIDLNGATATIGRADTVITTSDQDPAWTTGGTISCGDLTIDQDGVQAGY